MENRLNRKTAIDFFELMNVVLKDWKKMIAYCLFFGAVGVGIAFSIPKKYKASVLLAPEASNGSSFTSNISSLAAMVGMDLAFGNGNDAIYPEIYPELMSSNDFIVSLFPIQVKSLDGKIQTTYYDYKKLFQKYPWWSYPGIWIGNGIKKMFAKQPESNMPVNPFHLTKDQYAISQSINRDILCHVEKKTSVITIEVTTQDPLISATMADSVKERLQVFITNYRTNKARNDQAYMEQLYAEAKEQYAKARQRYASYSDANQDLNLESFRARQEELENEMQLRYNIYTQVVQQLQLAKAKVQERTPAFTVVQSASVPTKHSNKPKIYYLIGFMFLGALARTAMLAYKNKDRLLISLPAVE